MLKCCAAALIACGAAGAVSAEPVVVRWADEPEPIAVSDFTSQIPPLVLDRLDVTAAGTFNVYPYLGTDDWIPSVCDPIPFEFDHCTVGGYDATPPGAVIGPAMTGWRTAFYCFDFEMTWPSLLTGGMPDCGGTGCPNRELFLVNAPDGVSVIPIRIMDDAMEWHFGWIAIRGEENFLPDCNWCAPDPPVAMEYSDFSFIGIGYETEGGVPIVNGGGLCEADLNFDAVLDLNDVQAFVAAFTSMGDAADLNGDGLFDLADVQRFITSFSTGCGL